MCDCVVKWEQRFQMLVELSDIVIGPAVNRNVKLLYVRSDQYDTFLSYTYYCRHGSMSNTAEKILLYVN